MALEGQDSHRCLRCVESGFVLLLYGGIGAAIAVVAVLGILIFLKKRAA
ncbi:MAG: hypothetical protein J5945_03555 [Candidatus Methanomethylophilus sp.]|nr:hypothetical protein [Methanomethylophilus sp.]